MQVAGNDLPITHFPLRANASRIRWIGRLYLLNDPGSLHILLLYQGPRGLCGYLGIEKNRPRNAHLIISWYRCNKPLNTLSAFGCSYPFSSNSGAEGSAQRADRGFIEITVPLPSKLTGYNTWLSLMLPAIYTNKFKLFTR